jgi:capsular exopolysaccharide synthesis family protein
MTYAKFLARRWPLLVVASAVAAILAFAASSRIEERYTAQATVVLLNRTPAEGPTSGELTEPVVSVPIAPNALVVEQRLVTTYTQLVKRQAILDQAATQAGYAGSAEELAAKVSVGNPAGTQLITISATDGDPTIAAALANSIARSFIGRASFELGRDGVLTLAEPATPPGSPSGPALWQNLALAIVLALVGAAGLGILLEYRDQSIRSVADVEEITGLPALGVIPREGRRRIGRAWAEQQDSRLGEAFRRLRAALASDGLGSTYRSLLVTSESVGAGKSFVAANLAVAFSRVGLQVILVDLSLRKPSQHEIFDVANEIGAANFLEAGGRKQRNLGLRTDFGELRIIPAGRSQANPSDMLASARLLRLLEWLKSQADLVIIDAPALSSMSDTLAIARAADAALLVAASHKSKTWELTAAAERVSYAGCRLAGVVLNRARRGWRRAHVVAPRRLAVAPDLAPVLGVVSGNGTGNRNGHRSTSEAARLAGLSPVAVAGEGDPRQRGDV